MFKNGESEDSPLDFMYPIVPIESDTDDMRVTFDTKPLPLDGVEKPKIREVEDIRFLTIDSD
jgi:hypothetical protein